MQDLIELIESRLCHRNKREICTRIYNIVNLLKSYDNIHSMTYITKIMLTGIAIKNTRYYDNILLLKIKLKGIARIT